MVDSLLSINILNNTLIHSRTGRARQRHQGAIREVPAAPKVHRSSVSVSGNKFGISEINRGEAEVIRGRKKQRGANSKKRNNESPDIFQSILKIKNRFSTNNRAVGEGSPVKGNN